MKKIKKFSSLLCFVSLMLSATPMKAPANPGYCASWAIAIGYMYAGAIGSAIVCIGGINCCKALSNGCENLCQTSSKGLNKKESSKEDDFEGQTLLSKGPRLSVQSDEDEN
ncbi:MAG: hypothetical protein JSS34_03645 [Proteobacteria bacterium]|nr:hypothetical protein [Pseudomonadota bacterium]